MKAPSLTLGIEEEYQIIDPVTGELKSYITQILDEGKLILREQIKAELHQSMVEVGTEICQTPADARKELVKLRTSITRLAQNHGLAIASAGTHPFSKWETQEITPFERYLGVKNDMADLAQQLLIFGTHVHVGIEDRDFLIDAMNVARYFVPHILCLSTSSPFWTGRNTGLKSYRSIIFRHFPRSGIPPLFADWAEYEGMVETMVKTRCIPDGSKIWYDVRPNWNYPTLEFRVCDVCTRVDEAVCIAALFQAIIAKLWKLRRDNLTFRIYPTELIEENKWRAVRYGLDGYLIDLGKEKEVSARELIHEMIDWFLRDVIDELGTRKEIEYAYTIMDQGTSADRQLKVYRESGNDPLAVVRHLVNETQEGLAD
jgi:carboxylate-amine ligase